MKTDFSGKAIVQQFEGDHIEYSQLPTIQDGVISLSGSVKNGATLEDPESRDGLSVEIFYDPPLRDLTRGHLVRTSLRQQRPKGGHSQKTATAQLILQFR